MNIYKLILYITSCFVNFVFLYLQENFNIYIYAHFTIHVYVNKSNIHTCIFLAIYMHSHIQYPKTRVCFNPEYTDMHIVSI